MNLWINLYAHDVQKLALFYRELGFQPHPAFPASENEAGFEIGHMTIMLFKQGFFDHVIPHPITPPSPLPTLLLSFDLPSIEKAEMWVQRAIKLGGRDLNVHEMAKNPGFYNTGFIDPEGYYWNILVREPAQNK